MKVCELIKILEAFPQATISGTTVEYKETSLYDAGYVRTKKFRLDNAQVGDHEVVLNFGVEHKI